MSFPTSAPPGTPPKPWNFPATSRMDLPGGPQLVAVSMPALPVVHVRWTFRGGRAAEATDRCGAARLLGSVVRQGTAAYDSRGLADALDFLGARLGVSIGSDNASASVSALAQHLDAAMDLLDEVAFRPTLPEPELERERNKALQLLRHERSVPTHLAGIWLARLLYGQHVYGRPPGSEAGLRAITQQDLRDLHGAVFNPAQAQLLVVGAIDPDAVLQRLAARYGGGDGQVHRHVALGPLPTLPPRLVALDRPGAEQSAITFGRPMFPRNHPDYLPMRLLHQVLGGGASSRLFMDLRERRSLTYGAYSGLDLGVCGGDLSASLSTAPDKTADAVAGLWEHLVRIQDGKVEEEELEHARRYVVGSFPQTASGVGGVAALVARAWQQGLPDDCWSTYQADAAAVQAADLERVAQTWLGTPSWSAVVVGPGDIGLRALQTVGSVELVDADGVDVSA
jgi:zinc protease